MISLLRLAVTGLRALWRFMNRCRHGSPGCPKVECQKCWEDRQW